MDGDTAIGANASLRRSALYVALTVGVLAIPQWGNITRWYYFYQDVWVGILFVVLALVATRWLPRFRLPDTPPSPRLVYATAALLVVLLWAGTYYVMLDYPLTRDEHMVVFDGAIFSSGRLSAPLPREWAGYGRGLVPDFLLDVPGNALLVSAYMPANAAMRAAFGLVLDPALLNPLLAGLGLILLYRIARQLFPDCAAAVWVVVVGYVLSAQILVTAMTTYAMTGHLAFALLWLALFMRGGALAHAAAMAIGALAIGLHQIIFHPLFAGPFLLTLLPQRRWKLFAAYALVYALALLFWINWPQIVVAAAGLHADSGSVAGAGGFLNERVWSLLVNREPATVPLMLHNLLRALTWNALYVLPFIILAIPVIRRREGLALPLAGGLLLTILAMTILLPQQGHGWGYRYIHCLLGSALLLAGYGYRELARRDRPLADGAVGLFAGVTAVLVLPFLFYTTHDFVRAYPELDALMDRQVTDFVLVDTEAPSYAVDLVRNEPDLSNRPLRFSSRHLTAQQMRRLCELGSVTLVSRQEFVATGLIDMIDERRPVELRWERAGLDTACLQPAEL